ncbi:Hydrogenase maturation protein, carbamoyltransferase HypF [Malonomonas rubra DSM 5091]|uniref:Carbamoyltransferase n=1 Tax=Malonomonas rubra DSM 5091 TaxID=1122189 RepID=A0A1M6BK79_MALRU|nr:carbamoyltransferase HypF [Malonomonas rubra]SHI49111.1 Hydrogenase maturation protein, carbamoyltransferase HypF [Malonomonas rubra DSM 5091]
MAVVARRVRIEGIVQGVGFRPFIYRLARERQLAGTVLNDSQGVLIEIEGERRGIESFLAAIETELPPLASISGFQVVDSVPTGQSGFVIVESQSAQRRVAQIAPDSYVCPDCLRELFDPNDRRYRYPFINCTNCGPRYSIVTDIPYDRPLTTMVDFPMCPACQAEYEDPVSRRFHAQPNACADCGPQLTFADENGQLIAAAEPLVEAIERLRAGQIVAVKGLGGYHLAVDATNDEAVKRLRQRKHRDEKPFAVMAYNLEQICRFSHVSPGEERLLTSVERPIVLLRQRKDHGLSLEVAPKNKFFGTMIPYTPLHYLLLEQFHAIVMTSGNQGDEPIAFENSDAQNRLEGIADCYLQHNRRIHIRTDDSIARLLDGEPVLYRRSRGYVPRGVKLSGEQKPVLAVGAELKNTICLTRGDRAFLSHHIGDLKNQTVVDSMKQAIDHFQGLLEVQPTIIAHDLHPDYLSTHVAEELAGESNLVAVQHHHAHLASCLTDNGRNEAAIGVIFDGIGYGNDGHIWGGEFLVGDLYDFERVGQFAYRPMPGGDAATKEPWRMAVSYLQAVYGNKLPDLPFLQDVESSGLNLLLQMIEKQLNSPLTSSVGRLFDAVAALVGLRNRVSYEGQAAFELEMLIAASGEAEAPYRFDVVAAAGLLQIDAVPMIKALVADLRAGIEPAVVSARFHNGLAQTIVDVCRQIRGERGVLPVALSGGVFQNRYLTERSAKLLREAGFDVLLHRQVPPNDGGLALGQAVIAGARAGHE